MLSDITHPHENPNNPTITICCPFRMGERVNNIQIYIYGDPKNVQYISSRRNKIKSFAYFANRNPKPATLDEMCCQQEKGHTTP